MSIPYLSSQAELDYYLAQCDSLLLYFTASWCAPCQAIAPIMEKLYQKYQNVQIVKVDIDSHKQLAGRYQVTAVPNFIGLHGQKELRRVQGANVQGIAELVKELSSVSKDSSRPQPPDPGLSGSNGGGGAGGGGVLLDSAVLAEIESYKAPAFTALNGGVLFGEFEALNVLPVQGNSDVKNVVRAKSDDDVSGILSDADSQLILHVPFTNIAKVESILVKFKPGKTNDDDDDELQRPTKLKIWSNRASIISFEDAESLEALHEEHFSDDKWDKNGWYQIKLKYVRFQKVSSLDLFFDGDDEDEHTSVEKIIFIGVDGESKNQPKLEKLDMDQ